MALRTRKQLLLCKTQSSVGTEASGIAAASNALSSIGISPAFNPNVIEDNELRGGLGAGDIVIGATTLGYDIRSNLRGSGSAGAAPEYADLWESAGLLEALNTTPHPASGTTTCSSSGSTTTLVFQTASTNWPTTSGSLIGEPVEIGGTESPAVVALITGYAYSGGTVTMTIDSELANSTTTSTTVKRLVNALYKPHSAAWNPATIWHYLDGILIKGIDFRSDWSMEWSAGGKGIVACRANGVYTSRTDASFPTSSNLDSITTQPPIWVNGRMNVNRKAVAASRLSLALNNGGTFPANPNATEGYDAYEVTGRSVQGGINPLLTLVATRDLFATLKANTVVPISAMLGARSGGTAGNRVGLLVPSAKFRGYGMSDDGGVTRDDAPFQCQGVDGEFYLTIF